ncbi:30S ribosomal protein S16 [Myxococcota bacterium]|nr:30S ribosomal protein S16 [Myxococcota bacterium]
MSVKLRLARHGSKKNPFYRVVAADTRSRRDGRFLEVVGTYDPQRNPTHVQLDGEKIRSWIAKGAQPTDKVRALIRKAGVLRPSADGAVESAQG